MEPRTDRSAAGDRGAPRVSIVVPAYNRASTLAATLQSVQAQTETSWELVVFDDGSTDRTCDVADRFAEGDSRIRVARGRNGGVAAARNRGLACARPDTEFVIFLDSDDTWEPNALATLVRVLDDDSGCVAAHCIARCMDAEGRPIPGDDLVDHLRSRQAYRGGHLRPVPEDEPTDFGALSEHNWILTPGTTLIRRSVLDLVGEFDPATDPADDWDLAIRLSRRGPLGYVPEPLLNWRRHDANLTSTSPRWRRAYFRVRDKLLTDPTNTPDQASAARAAYRRSVAGARRDAFSQLGRRDLRGAVRSAAKFADAAARYVRASAVSGSVRLARAGRRTPRAARA